MISSHRFSPLHRVLPLILLAILAGRGEPATGQENSPPGDAAVAAPSPPATEPVVDEAPIPTQNMWDIVRDGGPLMIPIGLCSLIMVAFVFERAISLRRERVIPRPFVTRFLQQLADGELDRDQALALCEENGSPVARILGPAVRKWGRPAVEVEQAIIDAGERVTNGLRRYLRVLNGVATIAPLLGLLGTVTGMIKAFNSIATSDALGRPEMLANGISEALLTTAAGLTVAIPALVFYLLFISRVDRLIIDMDALGQEVVKSISAEEIQNRGSKPAGHKVRKPVRKETVG
ncbi:MAG: MotA/TolQ/ExbB proton channel family protein [Rhodopirellula sp.]|nr:MotA/TolQ/ExbB proton channel family protein [Rhodopirellula sp.]